MSLIICYSDSPIYPTIPMSYGCWKIQILRKTLKWTYLTLGHIPTPDAPKSE